MRQFFAVLALCACAGPVVAADCAPLAEYRVGKLSFNNRPLDQALWRAVRGTPFKVLAPSAAANRVKVSRLSGDLESVVTTLVEQAGMAYTVENCRIRVIEKTAALPAAAAKAPLTAKAPAEPRSPTGVRVPTPIREPSLLVTAPAYFDLALGAGEGMPLGEALQRIVPKNWTYTLAPEVAQRKVSWLGGREWPRVLGDMMREQGMQAVVDVAALAVRIEMPARPATAEVPAVWTLQADIPIHVQFAEWARRAGWNYEWRLEKSWRVPAATSFSGTFDQALAEAVEALHAQGKPVRLILWEGNRFAEIVDVDAK